MTLLEVVGLCLVDFTRLSGWWVLAFSVGFWVMVWCGVGFGLNGRGLV